MFDLKSWIPQNMESRSEYLQPINEPCEVLGSAEGYAATGIPLVKDMMNTGHLTHQKNGKLHQWLQVSAIMAVNSTGSQPMEASSKETIGAVEAISGEAGFAPPPHLVWETGPYSHQGEAVCKWETSGRRGILAMATGAGKTVTALIGAWRLWRELRRLVLIVAAPTLPLVRQWAYECEQFGLAPYIVGRDQRRARMRQIDERLHRVELLGGVETLIVTNNFLADPQLRDLFNTFKGSVLLIADEVHNLGGGTFLANPINGIDYRLGLSATPRRQYDPDGSTCLNSYFGGVVYEFRLADAIGACLVPYDYHVHTVSLNRDELNKYREVSDKIARLIAAIGKHPNSQDKERLQLLLNRRRLVLDTAEGKLEFIKSFFRAASQDDIKHTLVYTTDKAPEQLKSVNAVIRSSGFSYHQITTEETGNNQLMESVLDSFRQGYINVLTAKRVLDEGLNIPEITTAIILASTTVERQWVQRRGRILRMCPLIGKKHAVIHDCLVLPPLDETHRKDMKNLVEGELVRCDEFTELARNRASRYGPRDVLQDVRMEYLV